MITVKLILPFNESEYHLDESLEWSQESDSWEECPNLTAKFYEQNEEGDLIENPKYSNLTRFIEDLEMIIERDGWECIHSSIKGVMMRHPAIELIMRGEIPASIKVSAMEL